MIRVHLIGHEGQVTTAKELLTADELREAADKARALVCECELLMRIKLKEQHGPQKQAPYST